MSDLSTELRAFVTRRREPTTMYSYVLVLGLLVAVVLTGAVIAATQLRGL